MTIRHALLALLSDGAKYGLQLRHEFEARTGEVWPLNVGQVYTTLQRLERDGFVESDDAEDGPQKRYQITPAGGQALHEWLVTPSDAAPPRDELVIKVMVALAVPGVDVGELVQVHRRGLLELMQRFTRLKENAPDLTFSERFAWTQGRTEISLEFWADESVLDYAVDAVAPCTCRN